MSALPRGWARATLGEVTTIVSGSTPKTGVDAFWGGDIAWITPDDLSRNSGKTIAVGRRSLTQAGYDSCSTTLMPPGTVLYSSRAPIGYAAIATEPVCTNQGFKSFVPTRAVTSDFLYWFVTAATPEIRRLGSGTTFPELSKKSAAGVEIRLPPLHEQRRIVKAIEEHLSRLDAADESVAAAQSRVRGLRGSVLDAASSDAMERWGLQPITEACVSVTNGNTPPASAMTAGSGDIPFIKVYNLTLVGALDFSKKPTFVDRKTHEQRLRKSRLLPGDVLINIVGPPLGKVAVVPSTFPEWNTNQAVVAFRPRVECLSSELLALWLQSRPIMAPLFSTAKATAGQFNLSISACRRLEIPLPPLDEQRRIVARIEEQLSAVDALRAAIERAQRRSASLRRAVLERAFRGELVPQDPSDEPATVLLKRIQAEREATTHSRRRRRRVSA